MENNEKNIEEQKNKASVKQFILIIAAAVIIIAVMLAVELGKTDEGEATQQKPTPTQAAADTVEDNNGQTENTHTDTEDGNQEVEVMKEQDSSSVEPQAQQETATEAPKVAPTFMYFITNADKEQADAIVEKLKREYKDVNFDVRNVDESPEELENFPIAKGNTPFLIMLNTNNDPCAFEQVSDEARLKEIIESAKN